MRRKRRLTYEIFRNDEETVITFYDVGPAGAELDRELIKAGSSVRGRFEGRTDIWEGYGWSGGEGPWFHDLVFPHEPGEVNPHAEALIEDLKGRLRLIREVDRRGG